MTSARVALDDGLEDEWERLADSVDAAPWLRPGWVTAWWRAFGRGALEVQVVRRDGALAAVIPLERHGARLSATANWHTPSVPVLAADAAAAGEALATTLLDRARHVSLAFVRTDDGVLDAWLSAAAATRRSHLVRTLERSPYIALRPGLESWQDALGSKLRGELRRRRRRLEEQGEVAVDVRDGSQDLDALLEEGFRIEAAAWKGERGTAIASDAATRDFYVSVARWAAARGWLRLAFLRLDGRPLAFDLCLERGGVHALLKTGFEPEARRLAPGLLLRDAMIRRAFDLGLVTYEFLGADEPWKLAWTSTVRELKLLQAFAPTPAGRVERAAWAYGRPLAKRALALARR